MRHGKDAENNHGIPPHDGLLAMHFNGFVPYDKDWGIEMGFYLQN